TPEELERPVFTGEGDDWLVRDLISHWAAWQDRGARAARKIAADGAQTKLEDRARTIIGLTETVDEMKAVAFQAAPRRPVVVARAYLRARHAELMAALAALTPQQLMTGETVETMYLAFRAPAYEHLWKHRTHLNAALTREGVAR